MKFELPVAIFHEITARGRPSRTPETALVMDGEQTVADYSSAGEQGGALYGPYLYNAIQVCARIKPGDQVLDLGCGSGRLLNLIALWSPGIRFTGVDLAPTMLAQAREQAKNLDLTNVGYIEGDFSTLSDIPDHSVDAVISSMALHHLPDRAALTTCFAAIGRVLRPGGVLYLMDFGRLRSRRAMEILVSKVARTESPSVSQDYRESLLAAFTPEDFALEVANLGRTEVTLHRTVVAPLVMIACTPLPRTKLSRSLLSQYRTATNALSSRRRAELAQLRIFLKFGGMGFPS